MIPFSKPINSDLVSMHKEEQVGSSDNNNLAIGLSFWFLSESSIWSFWKMEILVCAGLLYWERNHQAYN